MTWVVGIPHLLSAAIGLGDVRITVRHGRHSSAVEEVGVQKLHEIAPWVAMGFAGSIELGFRAVNDFRHFLSSVPEGGMVYPGFVTWHWARRVRYIFNRLSVDERRGGLELLILGASPGVEPFPVPTHGYILRGPRFDVEAILPEKSGSIGSGSAVPALVGALDDLLDQPEDLFGILQFAVGDMGNIVLPVSILLTEAIQAVADPTISEHLHLCFLTRGEIRIGTNDMESLTPEIVESRAMPPVARNLGEFRALAQELGISAGDARA
jgi:hypothetical protein